MYIYYLGIAVAIGTLVQVLVLDTPVLATLLAWFLGVQVGLGAIWAFLGHYFKPDEIAAYIGWPSGSPFQKEIAFANLALGACGILCLVLQDAAWRDGFWLATIIFATILLGGAATVHAADQRERGNTNPGNAGPVFYADILIPVAAWMLFLAK